jgi:hypothetical protein
MPLTNSSNRNSIISTVTVVHKFLIIVIYNTLVESFPLSYIMLQQLSFLLVSFVGQLFSHGSTSPSSPDFLVQDFAVIMIVAAIMLIITHRLKQPMVNASNLIS